MILVWIFIPLSFVEPAYLIYRINKVCFPIVLYLFGVFFQIRNIVLK